MPFDPTLSKLVLVEGREEERFLGALLQHLRLSGVEVKDYGGKDKLGGFLKGLVKAPGFRGVESLGVLRDADSDAQSAFRSVVSALQGAGLEAPRVPEARGGGRPVVTVLILPDGKRPGMLEDACMDAVRDEPVVRCVDSLFDCVKEVGEPGPANMSKARAYVYLATRREPGRRVGEAAEIGIWPFSAPAFEPIRGFLARL